MEARALNLCFSASRFCFQSTLFLSGTRNLRNGVEAATGVEGEAEVETGPLGVAEEADES